MLRNLKCVLIFIKLIFGISILLSPISLYADDITLQWDAPLYNAPFCINASGHNPDQVSCEAAGGTWVTDDPLLPVITGYIIYYGTSSGNYANSIDVKNVTSTVISNLSSGTWYFTVTAYNEIGNESDYSDELIIYISTIDTTLINYYCDEDMDVYVSSAISGSCNGTGCQPIDCEVTSGNDCDDSNSAVHPESDDSACNGLDDDCDGQTDEDYVAAPSYCGEGVCASTGQVECQNGSEVDTCTPWPQDEGTDVMCDGLDGDCDGLIDEDYAVSQTNCGVGECLGNTGQLECQAGAEVDTCDPLAGATTEVCDNLDNNCDGQVDEDSCSISPEIISHAFGSTLSGSIETFTWTANETPVNEWWIWAGTSPGGQEILNSGSLDNSTYISVSGLPIDGSTVYIRLHYTSLSWSENWSWVDYEFTANTETAVGLPEMLLPVPESTLSGSIETFTWTANETPVNEWWIWAGTSPGGQEILNSGSLDSSTSSTITGLPNDGRTVYVRLWYKTAEWHSRDFQYTSYTVTGVGLPNISFPFPGSTLSGPIETFTWTSNGITVSDWWLWVGTSMGGQEILNSGSLDSSTSRTVTGLPNDGRIVYVRLWYNTAGWQSIDFQYMSSH